MVTDGGEGEGREGEREGGEGGRRKCSCEGGGKRGGRRRGVGGENGEERETQKEQTHIIHIFIVLTQFSLILHNGLQVRQSITDLQKYQNIVSDQKHIRNFVHAQKIWYHTSRTLSSCFWFSTTKMLALQSLAMK